ncbi:D-2-hydroxyacid dehydrogenase [Sphingomonas sp.]|jgi:phosphoglycerate dehydrogenase-like enzyme|uniref:D-2-hydroxyacid dehydrogenase n=1 Tax=Sphingomonas sp. TaxID=28214 RepID=UPI002EDAB70D
MTTVLAYLKEPELSAIAIERLAAAFPDVTVHKTGRLAEVEAVIADVEVLVTIGPVLDADAGAVFRAACRLRWVQTIGTGTDNILGHPDLSPTVAVTNVRGVHGAQMSEAAIGAMLAMARDIPRIVRNQDEGRWERFAPRLLAGGTVGIVGTGAIAEALAPRCKALGMTVVGISASPRELPHFDRVEPRADLPRIAGDLDWLVLLTPYSADTHHLIGADVLSAMKPDACLVNLARGGVVDEDALLAALDAGEISGAALDVFAHEPLAGESRFWRHPRVIVTPHLGGFHGGYADQVLSAITDNFTRYRAGGTAALINRVN